ncbi:MAG TPA: helix-turn-helix transcriptional regulator [Thermomicrobiales bacterium]|jgi:transcriptional regulator with XRE-family HTH domain|nr:helix-turn-helix transcriptional regulator [Thermomicrobiales bacterium]
MAAALAGQPVGQLLRQWREARRLSQLELAGRGDVSTRHLSFIETGRSQPSREMIIRLAEEMDVPLRERNRLCLAGGFAPAYTETELDAPPLGPVRAAIRQILRGHEPYPAVVVNRHWEIVEANAALGVLTVGLPRELLATPANVLRASLHPDGLAPRIVNLAEWRAHLLGRLRQQVDLTADERLVALYAELTAYPEPDGEAVGHEVGIAVPLRLRHGDGELALISTITTFGTAIDITAAELSIEAFYPADERTTDALRAAAGSRR